MFSLKIVTVDHYQAVPIPDFDVSYSDFRGSEVQHVPVIRIFGVTPRGQKACLHVHGVFPYISLPFDGGGYGQLEKFMQQLVLSIDKALNIAAGNNNASTQHVYKISLISGIPFYGYHDKEQKFLRIYFYNPVDIKRTVELLQSGAILNQIMQPHEAHIPYILQFFIDYNLYGMSFINIIKMKFRRPLNKEFGFQEFCSEDSHSQIWNVNNLSSAMIMNSNVDRVSSCELEVDCCAECIMNRKEIIDSSGMNPGLAAIWQEERHRQQFKGNTLQLTPQPSQSRNYVEETESEIFYKNRLKKIIEQITDTKKESEDNSSPEEESCIADADSNISCIPASIVENHSSKNYKKQVELNISNGKETSLPETDPEYTVMKSQSLSQNALNEEDQELLEMIISMVSDQTLSLPEEVDSILSTEQSLQSFEEENDDELETLEMSQYIWDEDICLDSNIVKRTVTGVINVPDTIESNYSDSESIQDNMMWNVIQKSSGTSSTDPYSAKQILNADDFVIPQIDGTHDSQYQKNEKSSKKVTDYPGRQVSLNSHSSSFFNINQQSPWMQGMYTANRPAYKQYDCYHGAFAPYNQSVYCVPSNSHYTNYAKQVNQTSLPNCSQNLLSNREWFSNPSSSCNSMPYQSLPEGVCSHLTASCTMTSSSSSSSCKNSINNERFTSEQLSNQPHISYVQRNDTCFETLVSSPFKNQDINKSKENENITANSANTSMKSDVKETATFARNNCTVKDFTDIISESKFDVVKNMDVNKSVQTCSLSGFSKTKNRIVCNTATQTNSVNFNNNLNETESVNNEKKFLSRTLIIQKMKRLKLSLSNTQIEQKTENWKEEKIEKYPSEIKSLLKSQRNNLSEKVIANIKSYPFIHRPAPELSLKMKLSNNTPCKLPFESSGLHHDLNGLRLPSYITESDLAKFGNEKVIVTKLENNLGIKNSQFPNHNNKQNKVKRKKALPILKMKINTSINNTLNKVKKNTYHHVLNSASELIDEDDDDFVDFSRKLKGELIFQKQSLNIKKSAFPFNTYDSFIKNDSLKLTIKLPNLIRKPRVAKRKRKSCSNALQPDLIEERAKSSHRLLKLCENTSDNAEMTVAKGRSKRQNVDYHSHAYTHLLNFDKMIELPKKKIQKPRKSSIDELLKQCKKLEVRVEKLNDKFLVDNSLSVDSVPSSNNDDEMHFQQKSELTTTNSVFQCVNMYPVSVDTTNHPTTENYNPGSNDHSDEYLDTMWNLSYLSPSSNREDIISPPQCWSPDSENSDENKNETTSEINNTCLVSTDDNVIVPIEQYNIKNDHNEEQFNMPSISVESNSLQSSNADDTISCVRDNLDIYKTSTRKTAEILTTKVIGFMNEENMISNNNLHESNEEIEEVLADAPFQQITSEECISESDNNYKSILEKSDSIKSNFSEHNVIYESDLSHDSVSEMQCDEESGLSKNNVIYESNSSEIIEQDLFIDLEVSHNNSYFHDQLLVATEDEDKGGNQNCLPSYVQEKIISSEMESKDEAFLSNDLTNKNEIIQKIEDKNLEVRSDQKQIFDSTELFTNEATKHQIYLKEVDNAIDQDKYLLCTEESEKSINLQLCVEAHSKIECPSVNNIVNSSDNDDIFITQNNILEQQEEESSAYNEIETVSDDSSIIMEDSVHLTENDLSQSRCSLDDSEVLHLSDTNDSNISLFHTGADEISQHSRDDSIKDKSETCFPFKEKGISANIYIEDRCDDKCREEELVHIKDQETNIVQKLDMQWCKQEEIKNPNEITCSSEKPEICKNTIDVSDSPTCCDLNTPLNDSLYIASNISSEHTDHSDKDNLSTSLLDDIDSSPLSPEEKVIYDSDGNMMSSTTCSSQYSLCLGDHNISSDNEIFAESYQKEIKMNKTNIMSNYILMKNNCNEINNLNGKREEKYNENQNCHQDCNKQNNVVLQTEKDFHNSLNENSSLIFPSTITNEHSIIECNICKNIDRISKQPSFETSYCLKDDKYRKLCNKTCLLNNNGNLLESGHIQNASLCGSFEEMTFFPPGHSNSDLYTNKNNTELVNSSDFPKDLVSENTTVNLDQYASQADIESSEVCCRTIKNVPTYQSFDSKSENSLKYVSRNLSLKTPCSEISNCKSDKYISVGLNCNKNTNDQYHSSDKGYEDQIAYNSEKYGNEDICSSEEHKDEATSNSEDHEEKITPKSVECKDTFNLEECNGKTKYTSDQYEDKVKSVSEEYENKNVLYSEYKNKNTSKPEQYENKVTSGSEVYKDNTTYGHEVMPDCDEQKATFSSEEYENKVLSDTEEFKVTSNLNEHKTTSDSEKYKNKSTSSHEEHEGKKIAADSEKSVQTNKEVESSYQAFNDRNFIINSEVKNLENIKKKQEVTSDIHYSKHHQEKNSNYESVFLQENDSVHEDISDYEECDEEVNFNSEESIQTRKEIQTSKQSFDDRNYVIDLEKRDSESVNNKQKTNYNRDHQDKKVNNELPLTQGNDYVEIPNLITNKTNQKLEISEFNKQENSNADDSISVSDNSNSYHQNRNTTDNKTLLVQESSYTEISDFISDKENQNSEISEKLAIQKDVTKSKDNSLISLIFQDNTLIDTNIQSVECESERTFFENNTANVSNMSEQSNHDINKVNCETSVIYSFYATNKTMNSGSVSKNEIAVNSTENPDFISYEKSKKVLTKTVSKNILVPKHKPPTYKEIKGSLSEYNIPETKYQAAFYSDLSDVSKNTMEVGDIVLKIPTNKISSLSEFDGALQQNGLAKWQNDLVSGHCNINSSPSSSFSLAAMIKNNPELKVALASNKVTVLTPVQIPPTKKDIKCELNGIVSNKGLEIETELPDTSEIKTNIQTLKCSIENLTNVNTLMKKTTSFCYHSTPLRNKMIDSQKYIKRKRSNSWNGNETITEVSLPKRRRTSGNPLLPDTHVGTEVTKFSPICSPIIADDDTKTQIHKRKRQLLEVDNISSTPSIHPKRLLKKALHADKIKNQLFANDETHLSSEIEGPTVQNTYNFKITDGNIREVHSDNKFQYLTIMSLEVHMQTRGDLQPDPQYDSIQAVFYYITNDFPDDYNISKELLGIIIVDNKFPSQVQRLSNTDISKDYHQIEKEVLCNNLLERSGIVNQKTLYVDNEMHLLQKLSEIVKYWDPDIVCGYEIQLLSWGYVVQRAAHLNINMCQLLSRIPEENSYGKKYHLSQGNEYGSDSEVHITGRVILNVWKLMRKEVTLNIYTFENVVYHVLHQRIPQYSFHSLTHWFNYKTDLFRWRVIEYYTIRVKNTLKLLNQLDFIGRTSTLARVFGIQFYEVLSRGSQFRVESLMLRTAKPSNYIAVSPSIQQRAHARAPEWIPLVMEPESKLYTSPVIVLDFQSLYPSMIIAYNYCFSTCLGRIEHLGKNTPFEFGCTSLTIPQTLLKKLENDITVSPSGVAFVKTHVRTGILPRMLEDILNTRIMVKKAMKEYKEDKSLHKLLDARQLGLKLIANVTYGYTSANFSGRMPCIEIADSIVSKARETLERAISLVEKTSKWNAKVVYGDTDSMFILLEGRSKEQAFKIGQEIADAVTAINPKPVKLKFEKVYLPCVLQTKKRYVGFMYETPEQKEPVYDAKGIETVRRDSCPAVAKILEKSLKILFTSKNLSLVKRYVQKQFQKLLSEKANIQDCIFAREYRGRSGYSANACVPALEIARRLCRVDPRAEPRNGERVPYVIVYGYPGLPLIQLVRQPKELLQDPGLKINSKYYVSRVIIPPLHRIFSLIGADVTKWYLDIPQTQNLLTRCMPETRHKRTLSQYFTTLSCPICNEPTDHGICNNCQQNSQCAVFILNEKIRKWERKFHHLSQICQSCTGTRNEANHCISLDCPILFKLCQSKRDLDHVTYLRQFQNSLDF